MEELAITFLGSFEVRLNGHILSNFPTRKAKALLAYLVIEKHKTHRRTTLANLFWPDQPEINARHSLRQTLFYLKKIVPQQFFLSTKSTLCLSSEQHVLADVHQFQQASELLKSHDHGADQLCSTCFDQAKGAADLYQGDFLKHFYLEDSQPFEEWSLLWREHLQQAASKLYTLLTNDTMHAKNYDMARHYARRQLQLNPLHEHAHQQLIQILEASGRRNEAIKQYQCCRSILDQELGLPPTQATEKIYRDLLNRATAATTSPSPDLGLRQKNIPPLRTPLIGRQTEINQIIEHLENDSCRLLTLTGPAGIGKTHLALQIAHQLQRRPYWADLYFVSADQFSTLGELKNEISQLFKNNRPHQIGRSRHQGSQVDQTKGQNSPQLLIVDGIDHLLPPHDIQIQMTFDPVSWLNTYLDRSINLKILVTSRELLRLRTEQVFELQGLAYPTHTNTEITLQKMLQNDAVQLFQASAQQIQPSFTLAADTMPDVITICQATDGLPLALHLAGSMVRWHTCAEIATNIKKNIKFLSAFTHDIPPKHKSLTAAFDQSWHRLTQQERMVLRTLTILPERFNCTQARMVIGTPTEQLASLVTKSLLRRLPNGDYQQHRLLYQYTNTKKAANGRYNSGLHRHS